MNVLSGRKLVWLAPPSVDDVARDYLMKHINEGKFHTGTDTLPHNARDDFFNLGIRWIIVDAGIYHDIILSLLILVQIEYICISIDIFNLSSTQALLYQHTTLSLVQIE